MTPTFQGQVQFMAWGDSHTSGPWIKLRLVDSDALEPFRGMTAAKAGMAGQLMACVLVEQGDDEQPVQREKGGPLSQLAGRWCNDPAFQQWLASEFPDRYRLLCEQWSHDPELFGSYKAMEVAAQVLRAACGVASRAELDHDPEAAALFHALIRVPYQAHLQGAS
jgi:hypothetical protein